MKIKKYSSGKISIIIFITAIICVQTTIGNELYYLNAADLDDIENLIIINGLEADTNNPLNYDNDDAGIIIYDDTFDDFLSGSKIINEADKYKTRNRKRDRKNIKTNDKKNIISKLKEKDEAWHLTPHKIRRGENLWEIARKYDTDYKLIIKANNITRPDLLNNGKIISIPNKNGIKYKIKKGDTLNGISKKYNTDINKIISNNNIKKNLIKIGEPLFIPDAIECDIAENKINNKKIMKDEPYKIAIKFDKKHNFIWPLRGEITSAFGNRKNPVTNKVKFHCGVDIRADIASPVKASEKGKVIFNGWKQGYGRVMIIKHENGYISVYAHNNKNLIAAGDEVEKGETIALSGISGAVTGPHLHFEIRKYLTPLNPMRFL